MDVGTVIGVLAVVVVIGFVIWKATHRNGGAGGSGGGSGRGPGREQNLK